MLLAPSNPIGIPLKEVSGMVAVFFALPFRRVDVDWEAEVELGVSGCCCDGSAGVMSVSLPGPDSAPLPAPPAVARFKCDGAALPVFFVLDDRDGESA
jgi:hypothetical protein